MSELSDTIVNLETQRDEALAHIVELERGRGRRRHLNDIYSIARLERESEAAKRQAVPGWREAYDVAALAELQTQRDIALGKASEAAARVQKIARNRDRLKTERDGLRTYADGLEHDLAGAVHERNEACAKLGRAEAHRDEARAELAGYTDIFGFRQKVIEARRERDSANASTQDARRDCEISRAELERANARIANLLGRSDKETRLRAERDEARAAQLETDGRIAELLGRRNHTRAEAVHERDDARAALARIIQERDVMEHQRDEARQTINMRVALPNPNPAIGKLHNIIGGLEGDLETALAERDDSRRRHAGACGTIKRMRPERDEARADLANLRAERGQDQQAGERIAGELRNATSAYEIARDELNAAIEQRDDARQRSGLNFADAQRLTSLLKQAQEARTGGDAFQALVLAAGYGMGSKKFREYVDRLERDRDAANASRERQQTAAKKHQSASTKYRHAGARLLKERDEARTERDTIKGNLDRHVRLNRQILSHPSWAALAELNAERIDALRRLEVAEG